MARRPLEEQGDTHEEILEAAFRLFGRYGYDGVSMASVASEAGIKKASLYYHYPSKERLYYDCTDRLHTLFNQVVLEPMRRNPDGVLAQFLALFDGVKRLIADPRLEHGIAGYWIAPSTADLLRAREAHDTFTREATAAISAVLAAGVQTGEVDYAGDVQALSRAVMAVVEVIALPLQGRGEAASVIDHLGGTFIQAYLMR
ncbi:MAG: TetR/AcrR family transcriptional regulator [Myxococcota bacterium]